MDKRDSDHDFSLSSFFVQMSEQKLIIKLVLENHTVIIIINAYVHVCNWITHLQIEWQSACRIDNSFLQCSVVAMGMDVDR